MSNYNISFIVKERKEIPRCRICNKQRINIPIHQKSKYCLAVKKVLDKLSPKEVGLLNEGKAVDYFY